MQYGARLSRIIPILVLLIPITLAGQAYQTQYVGTANRIANWEVRAGGMIDRGSQLPTWVPAAQVINSADSNGPIDFNDWAISLSSDGSSNGVKVPYFTDVGWNGVWFARTSFDLPASANYAILIIKPIVRKQHDNCCGRYFYAADDRVVLGMNNFFGLTSATVGWSLSQKDNPVDRAGVQNSAEYGTNNIPYVFSNRSVMYITDQQAFKFGQTNYIYLTINNTGSYQIDRDSRAWTSTDITLVGVDIWVAYGDRSQFPIPHQ
jgi:hypothetical protein